MSLLIGDDIQPTNADMFDHLIYDDVEDKDTTKYMEIAWDRQEAKKKDKLSPGIDDPDHFVPCDIDESCAVGLYYPTAVEYKKECGIREVQMFAQQWKTALVRCKTKTKWKIINERYCKRAKKDKAMIPAMRQVLTDTELLEHEKTLDEEREDDNQPLQDDGIMERPFVDWSMKTVEFASHEQISAKDNHLLLLNGRVVFNFHKHIQKKDRKWRNGPKFQYLDRTFPTLRLVGTKGFILAYNTNRATVRVDLYHWNHKERRSRLERTWYIYEAQEHSFLQCKTSSSGQIIALGNELCVHVWHIESERPDRYEWPLVIDEETKRLMLVTALTINDDNELTIGSVQGHIHRINVVERASLVKTMIADAVPIMCVERRGTKTIVHTVNSVYIVECGFQNDKMVEIPTIERPMCMAIRGSKILCLGKYGMTRLYSSTQRSLYIDMDVPKGLKVEIVYTIPWYNGLSIGPGTRSFHMLLPDGQIRDINSGLSPEPKK